MLTAVYWIDGHILGIGTLDFPQLTVRTRCISGNDCDQSATAANPSATASFPRVVPGLLDGHVDEFKGGKGAPGLSSQHVSKGAVLDGEADENSLSQLVFPRLAVARRIECLEQVAFFCQPCLFPT